jgi:protoporphyrinogen oxidase
MKNSVCIIGAGLTGLVTAYRLLSKGYPVTLVESTLVAGGMVSTFSMGWEKIEYIYHHIFTTDSYVTELAGELGLEDHIQWLEPKNALFLNGEHHSFTSPSDLLRFKPIPFLERVKTGLAVLLAKRISDITELEKMTAKDWLVQKSGHRAYETVWKPLLRSKFDEDADLVSAVWIWNKFKLRGNSRKKSVNKELLGYMDGGFGTLVQALVKEIQSLGGEILFGYTALNITPIQDDESNKYYKVACVLEDCSSVVIDARSVVATVSGTRFASMTRDLDLGKDFNAKIHTLRYKCDLCMVLRLKESLSDYYWTTCCDDLPFVVAIEHTNLTSVRKYGGHVIYLSRYLDISNPLWMQSDSEIYRLFCQGLQQMYPHFKPSDVKDWRLTRTRYAQPVITTDYSKKMPPLKTPANGIFLAGMAQIYPEDRGINYAIRLAEQTAVSVCDFFQRKA